MSDNSILRDQLFVPPLQYAVLYQTMNDAGQTSETICQNDAKWRSEDGKSCYEIPKSRCSETGSSGLASEACRITCDTCPGKIQLTREPGSMYDRLPSPVKDSVEPSYSSILKNGELKMGSAFGDRNTDYSSEFSQIEEKLDDIRKQIPKPRCGCNDITGNIFSPNRCDGASLSDNFEWSDEYTYLPTDSVDTDTRYKVQCKNGYTFANQVPSLKDKTLLYNCTANQWETKGKGRSSRFVRYMFPDGKILCEEDPSIVPEPTPEPTTPPENAAYTCAKIDGKDACVPEGDDGVNAYDSYSSCIKSCVVSDDRHCGSLTGKDKIYCNKCYDEYRGYIYGDPLYQSFYDFKDGNNSLQYDILTEEGALRFHHSLIIPSTVKSANDLSRFIMNDMNQSLQNYMEIPAGYSVSLTYDSVSKKYTFTLNPPSLDVQGLNVAYLEIYFSRDGSPSTELGFSRDITIDEFTSETSDTIVDIPRDMDGWQCMCPSDGKPADSVDRRPPCPGYDDSSEKDPEKTQAGAEGFQDYRIGKLKTVSIHRKQIPILEIIIIVILLLMVAPSGMIIYDSGGSLPMYAFLVITSIILYGLLRFDL